MSKAEDKRFEAFNKIFEELLGSVDDWADRDVNQFLADAGVDMNDAERVLYARVSDIAGTYNARNQNIPQPIAEFLKQMRPIDLPTRDPEVARNAARKWVASLRRPTPSIAAPEVVYAFRNKKEGLGAKDRDVLQRLEDKLKTRKRTNE
jgi:hypothetical protein